MRTPHEQGRRIWHFKYFQFQLEHLIRNEETLLMQFRSNCLIFLPLKELGTYQINFVSTVLQGKVFQGKQLHNYQQIRISSLTEGDF